MCISHYVRQALCVFILLSCVTACETRTSSEPYVSSEPVYVFQGDETEVKAFASTLASALMKKFNPTTGHDAYYQITSWSYNPRTEMYAIDLTATWAGKPDIFSDECESEIALTYNVARDGSAFSIDQPRINACVRSGQFSDVMWDAFKRGFSQN